MARIPTVTGSLRPADRAFLDGALVQSGATGVVEYDAALQRDVLRCTGAGTTNGYAVLRCDQPAAQPLIVLRVLLEYGTNFALSGAALYHVRLLNSALSVVGGVERYTSGVTMLKCIHGSLAAPYSGGDLRIAGIHELWYFLKRDPGAGYVGGCGNCGSNNISKIATNGGTAANDVSRIEVGCYPESGGAFTGDVRILALDVFDGMPDEIGLCYADADRRFFAGVPGLIEVQVPDSEPAGAALTELGISGPGHPDYLVSVAEVTGQRSNAKAASAVLVDPAVFTADGLYDGALLVFSARPFACDLPAQVLWTQASGNRAYLNRFHGALGVEATSYSSNGQSCELQTYTLTRCLTPDPVHSPRRRWIGLPGGYLVPGTNTIHAKFGAAAVEREILVEPFTPPAPLSAGAHRRGLALAVGCDDNLLAQGQLPREVPAQQPAPLKLYNAVITGTAHFYANLAWAAIDLLAALGVAPVSHLWDATALSGYTAAVGRKLLDVSRAILRQRGYAPWLFVAPSGQFTSSDAVNLLADVLARHSIARGSTGSWYTAWPENPAAALNSYSIANNTSSQSTDAAKAAELLSTAAGMAFAGGRPTSALVSVNVHAIGTGPTLTSVGLINALLAETRTQGIRVSSLWKEMLTRVSQVGGRLDLGIGL